MTRLRCFTGLQLAPAVVFGTSAGAGILANLSLRHPELLSGAVFHEPYFQSGVSHPDAVRAWRTALIERGMAMGGPRAATELFLRSVAGDETYERMDADLRERLLSNGDVLFDIEMATFLSYEPTPQEIEAIEIPCAVTAGADNRDVSVPGHWRYEAAQWLATHLHVPVVRTARGTHALPGTTPRLRPRAPAASPLTRELTDPTPDHLASSQASRWSELASSHRR